MDQEQPLLERFLRDECTDKERKIVYGALRDGMIDENFRHAIDVVLNEQDSTADIDRMKPVPEDILKNILSRINEQKVKPDKQRRVIPEWLKIAAAVVITLSVSWLAFQLKPLKEPAVAMNTIYVPAGQSVNLTLADGTNVWLNSRTTLKYPGVFTGHKRELILEGEAFFDVAHDPKKPFVVHAGEYDIQALGTQFDVEMYPQNGRFSASLLAGSIKVTATNDASQTIVLKPNSMALKQDGRLVSRAITDFDHYRWREGLICFKDMPFADLMLKFEKCYGIKIVVENKSMTNYAPTGKFRRTDGIDYALRVLQRNYPFKFERDEENHILYIK
jgi:ferric-dicitrate binding protein FerR (iron transport regulator)